MTISCCLMRWRLILSGRKSGRHMGRIMPILLKLSFRNSTNITIFWCKRPTFRILSCSTRGSFIMLRRSENPAYSTQKKRWSWKNTNLPLSSSSRRISSFWSALISDFCMKSRFVCRSARMAFSPLLAKMSRFKAIWRWGIVVGGVGNWWTMELTRSLIEAIECSSILRSQ